MTTNGGEDMCRYAKLSEVEIQKVRDLETELGRVCLLAVEKPPELAELDKEQLAKIQKLEKELGVRLVAYK